MSGQSTDKARRLKFFCRPNKTLCGERNLKMEIQLSNSICRREFALSCLNAFAGSLFLLCASVAAQDLPKEIRGYKVHRAKIPVLNKSDETDAKTKAEAFVKIGEPALADVSLTSIKLEVPAEIESAAQSGTVDFLAFRDFRVDGLAVEVEEYKESFEFVKNQTIVLPKPIVISLSAKEIVRGALKELKESKDEWTVTGRVFVFGRFKKSFLKFKRVVPVEVNLKIKNPLKTI